MSTLSTITAHLISIRQALVAHPVFTRGTGVAVDLGASAVLMGTTVGATLQNLGPEISFGTGSYPLPQLLRFGVSRSFVADRSDRRVKHATLCE